MQETTTMKAAVRERFGSPDVLELRDLERPPLTDDGVLVRVRAASVNRADWYELTGRPWFARPMVGLRRPKSDRVGSDFAGTVVAAGREDFTRGDQCYDLMIDNAGNRSFSACTRVLAREAIVVLVGGPMRNPLLGPLPHIVGARLRSMIGSRKAVFFVARFNEDDMEVLRELLETSKISPAIDRRYELSEIADALRYMGDGHARGKVVLTV